MKDKDLPFVQRESQFRRFERYIAEAMRKFPGQPLECVLINGMTVATFVARLRDAKTSFDKYKWKSIFINREKFDEIKGQLIVAQVGEKILFGDRATIEGMKSKDIRKDEIPEIIDANDAARTLKVADVPLKNFLVMLSHKRLLQPRLRVEGFTASEVASYQQQFDVSFDQNHDGSFILI